MNELMGLAILGLPTLAVAAAVLVGVVTVTIAILLQETGRKKVVAGLATGLIVILIPTLDEVVGRMYFDRLCSTESGARVYRQAELPSEYWDAQGTPKDRVVGLSPAHHAIEIGDRFQVEMRSKEVLSEVLRINKRRSVILEKGVDDPVSELIGFEYGGGWFTNATSLRPEGKTCPGPRAFEDLYRRTFVRKS